MSQSSSPTLCQCDGEVCRDGALANAALAAAHGDDVLHLRQHLAHLRARLRLVFSLYLHLNGHAVKRFGAVVLDGGFGGFHRRLQERVRVAREFQHHSHLPAAVLALCHSGLVCHHPTFYQVLLRAGIRHRRQRLHNHFRIYCHNGSCFLPSYFFIFLLFCPLRLGKGTNN